MINKSIIFDISNMAFLSGKLLENVLKEALGENNFNPKGSNRLHMN